MKRILMILSVCIVILSCICGKTLVTSGKERSDSGCLRYYKTIEVQPGDSLWTIADTYNDNSDLSIREYIKELKSINRMASDSIRAGDSITVVYFAQSPETT